METKTPFVNDSNQFVLIPSLVKFASRFLDTFGDGVNNVTESYSSGTES